MCVCVWTLAFFGDFKQNSGPDFIMVVDKKDTRFQPYHFRRGSFSGNSDFYKNAHVDIYWCLNWPYASIQSCWDSAYFMSAESTQWRLDYLPLWGVNEASSAKRCELCERTALCNASERSANQAHEEKTRKNLADFQFSGTFSWSLPKNFGTLPKNFLEIFICRRHIIPFLCYYCMQISRLKVRRLRRGSARIL